MSLHVEMCHLCSEMESGFCTSLPIRPSCNSANIRNMKEGFTYYLFMRSAIPDLISYGEQHTPDTNDKTILLALLRYFRGYGNIAHSDYHLIRTRDWEARQLRTE